MFSFKALNVQVSTDRQGILETVCSLLRHLMCKFQL